MNAIDAWKYNVSFYLLQLFFYCIRVFVLYDFVYVFCYVCVRLSLLLDRCLRALPFFEAFETKQKNDIRTFLSSLHNQTLQFNNHEQISFSLRLLLPRRSVFIRFDLRALVLDYFTHREHWEGE